MTMTIQETSNYLELNEFTTYRLVKSGKIPAEKNDDGKWIILKNNIDGLFNDAFKFHHTKS
jgi:excisionase family DNA binding protein